MLARRLPSILPPLTESEAIQVTSIYSAAGLLKEPELLYTRPFRSPHHDISVVGLIGGGPFPRPGRLAWPTTGPLLNELPEFSRAAL